MDKDGFKGARVAAGMSQSVFAVAIGISRAAVAKIEAGKLAISAKVADAVLMIAEHEDQAPPVKTRKAAPIPEGIDARRLPSEYDFEAAPVWARNLKREISTNRAFMAAASWDDRPAAPGWQRVPGCCRIVSDRIPDPIPFQAPPALGWRAVPTASGAYFDYETGHAIKPKGAGHTAPLDPKRLQRRALAKGEKR